MKTQATSFGFEVLVTYLLPGFIAALSALIAHGMNLNQARVILEWSAKAEIISSLVMVSVIVLFGAGIASIQALLETYALDKCTTRKLNICSEKFNEQWQYYIMNLQRNSYISRVVLFFQFETRLGLSLFLLGLAAFRLSWLHGVIFILIGYLFYRIGMLQGVATT
jgi:hypothetical protein